MWETDFAVVDHEKDFQSRFVPEEVEKNNWPDIIVVLCPGKPIIKNNIPVFNEKDDNGYLGSLIRMEAAVKIYLETRNPLLLIGGDEKSIRTMKKYLCDNGCDSKRIFMVLSVGNTLGNLHALRYYLEKCGVINCEPEEDTISFGLLTNAYHQHRTMLFASDIFEKDTSIKIVPLCAEAIIEKNNFYTINHQKRMKNEMKGVLQWLKGEYKDQYKTTWFWQPIS